MPETREEYHIDQSWKMAPMLGPPRSYYAQSDIVFLDLQKGTIDLAAASLRIREIIGAAEVASANAARESWVHNEPTELFDDDDNRGNYARCAYCGAWDGACSH